MGVRREKVSVLLVLFFSCYINRAISFVDSVDISPLSFDRLYPDTPVSRVLRTMKLLYATMKNVQNRDIKREDCKLAHIVEIQSLSVAGALQELGRAMAKGLFVAQDHVALIRALWSSLEMLNQDERVGGYMSQCNEYSILNRETVESLDFFK